MLCGLGICGSQEDFVILQTKAENSVKMRLKFSPDYHHFKGLIE